MNSRLNLMLGLAVASATFAQKKSNVIFILADDLGWKDLGCYGSSFYETPNIDQLAHEGVRFTDAYAACPVSSPTRVSIQTGRYPARVGVTDWIPGHQYEADYFNAIKKSCQVLPASNLFNMPLSEVTIAEIFKQNNYQTAHIGKWHCSEDSTTFPQYQGYDVNIAGCEMGNPTGREGSYFSPYNNPYLPDGPKGEYLTDRLGDECVKMIDKFKDAPFFINFDFYQVHLPLQAKVEKIAYFRAKAQRLGLDTLKHIYQTPLTWKTLEPLVKRSPYERMIQSQVVYAAMVASMDENVGKIIAELKRLNLYENTIIVFTSDNGGLSTRMGAPTSNSPLKGGKGCLYEGGVRVPSIVSWPGHQLASESSHAVVTSVDYLPSLIEMSGNQLPQNIKIDGESFAALFHNRQFNRGPIFWHYPHYHPLGGRPSSAIREGEYKLIEFLDNHDVELYNVVDDIGETQNLSTTNIHLTKKLQNKLNAWRKACSANMPEANSSWDKTDRLK